MNASTSTNAIYNTFLGSGSGYKNTTGYRNTFLEPEIWIQIMAQQIYYEMF